MRRVALPVLFACDEDWSAMAGDQRRRRCTACEHDVINLSALTEREARRTLAARAGGKVCVRYHHDAAGSVLFARPRRVGPAAALATALAGCTANLQAEPEPEEPGFLCEPGAADGGEGPAGQCEPEPPEPDCEEAEVEVEVGFGEGGVTMGVPGVVVMAPPLPPPPGATIGGSPRPRPRAPEAGLPLTTWLGTIEAPGSVAAPSDAAAGRGGASRTGSPAPLDAPDEQTEAARAGAIVRAALTPRSR
jgi:hypothetical protein